MNPSQPSPQFDEDALSERFSGLDTRVKMSNWYDIFSLFGTVRDIFVSDLLRDRVDFRTLVALRQHASDDAEQDEAATRRQKAEPATAAAPPAKRQPDGVFYDRHTYYEYQPSPGSNELWFDYASDVGDGFNPTFHVAKHLAATRVTPQGLDAPLPRGRFLILGGDEVYPSATREGYEQRFIRPYEAAAYPRDTPDRITAPHLYALPGNHDWYDGLANFMSIFAERRAIGLWRTQQRMSYFAIRLPHRVWILAVDIGLAGELDASQVEYFQGLVRQHMKDGGRIILCIAEPDWVKPRPNVKNLRDGLFYFERKLVDAFGPGQPRANVRVILRLAGDLHHYRRHQSIEGPPPSDYAQQQGHKSPPQGPTRIVENITAGGGGAFLHPTHELVANPSEGLAEGDSRKYPPGRDVLDFRCRAAFPDFATSRRLTRHNFAFLGKHTRMFGTLFLVYGPLYHLGIWLGGNIQLSALLRGRPEQLALASSPLSALALLVLVSGMSALLIIGSRAFALGNASGEIGEAKRGRAQRIYHRPHLKAPARRFGILHGVAQSLLWVATLLGGTLLGDLLLPTYLTDPNAPISSLVQLLTAVLTGAIGAALTLSCLGTYLFLAMTWPGLRLHANDAFASLRCEDFKNFLRIRLTEDELCIYPIGFKRVPRRWQFRLPSDDQPDGAPAQPEPLFTPLDATPDTQPFLIEKEPIRIRLRDEEQGPQPDGGRDGQ